MHKNLDAAEFFLKMRIAKQRPCCYKACVMSKSTLRCLTSERLYVVLIAFTAAVCSFRPAQAATFAPTRAESGDNLPSRLVPLTDRSQLLVQTDGIGRPFYQVDDMRQPAQSGSPDNGFTGNVWPGGIVYYQFSPTVAEYQKVAWRDAAAAWRATAALTFVESTGSGNYIYVIPSNSNDSYIGMIGGLQEMNISAWSSKFIIAHEIGHALGLIHEHCRTDRNNYVRVNLTNIIPAARFNFSIEPWAVQYGSYDFDSVMHYARNAASSNGANTLEPQPGYTQFLYTMGQVDHLSTGDMAGMAARYQPPIPPVVNDRFFYPTPLFGATGSTTGTNVGATAEPGEPALGSGSGRSVWYSWTAPATARVTMTTRGSSFDTLLAVYTGYDLPQLTQIAYNDDISSSEPQSSVTFVATGSTNYRIVVDGKNGATGAINLSWSYAAPENATFASAGIIIGPSGSVAGYLGGEGPEAGEPQHGYSSGGRSTWYSWTAPSTGVAGLVLDAAVGGMVAVYTGDAVGSLTLVGREECRTRAKRAELFFRVNAGVTYRIAVDGPERFPSYQLHRTLAGEAPPWTDNFEGRAFLETQSGSIVSTNYGATVQPSEPRHPLSQGHSIWNMLRPQAARSLVTVDTRGSDFPTALTVFTGQWYLGDLSVVGADSRTDGKTRVSFTTVQRWDEYNVSVDAAAGNGGLVKLNWLVGGVKADFDSDYYPDFVWQNTHTGERAIWLLRDGQLQTGVHLPAVGREWQIAGAADFNGDGHGDLVWQNSASGARAIWLMQDGVLQSPLYLPTTGVEWEIAAAADFNGDGQADLAWQNTRSGERAMWFMQSGSYMSSAALPTLPLEWRIAAAADFNSDGSGDLVWENTRTGERVIWFMRYAQFESAIAIQALPPQWRIVGAADFNDDTFADLVWQNSTTGERAIWLMRNGVFQSGSYLPAVDRAWEIVNH